MSGSGVSVLVVLGAQGVGLVVVGMGCAWGAWRRGSEAMGGLALAGVGLVFLAGAVLALVDGMRFPW